MSGTYPARYPPGPLPSDDLGYGPPKEALLLQDIAGLTELAGRLVAGTTEDKDTRNAAERLAYLLNEWAEDDLAVALGER